MFILQTNLETYNKKKRSRVSCRSLACNYKSYIMCNNILIKQTGKINLKNIRHILSILGVENPEFLKRNSNKRKAIRIEWDVDGI